MRIVVAAAPKAGNFWIKCLLGKIYDLHWLDDDEAAAGRPGRFREWVAGGGFPDEERAGQHEAFRAWVAAGGFPDQSIFHQHFRFALRLADAIEAVPAHLVTIVRDPYDVFVSLYHWAQDKAAHDPPGGKLRPRQRLVGKPLDHPDVLAFLADEFGGNLARAYGWLRSGRAVVVRYEGLHGDPIAELARATEQIAPVGRERIEAAIEACRAENMRQMAEKLSWHVRSAKVGDSRERLSEAHLAIFRERHADLIRALGYEVR